MYLNKLEEYHERMVDYITKHHKSIKTLFNTLFSCVDKPQQERLLHNFHNEACGDHYSSKFIAYKILRQFYYWPSMFKDSYKWVAKCNKCRMFPRKPQLAALPLKPVVIEGLFQ